MHRTALTQRIAEVAPARAVRFERVLTANDTVLVVFLVRAKSPTHATPLRHAGRHEIVRDAAIAGRVTRLRDRRPDHRGESRNAGAAAGRDPNGPRSLSLAPS